MLEFAFQLHLYFNILIVGTRRLLACFSPTTATKMRTADREEAKEENTLPKRTRTRESARSGAKIPKSGWLRQSRVHACIMHAMTSDDDVVANGSGTGP